jgi:hypothetical protein
MRRGEDAVADYPTAIEERGRIRAESRLRILGRANLEAERYGRTLACSGGTRPAEAYPVRHANQVGGCKAGPDRCLCHCHDLQCAPVVHGCPPGGHGLTACCSRPPGELPYTDRITLVDAQVTCSGPGRG